MKRIIVEEWWAECVSSGTQLGHLEGRAASLAEGERRGDGPWWRTVSIAALFDDFQSYTVQQHGAAIAKTFTRVGFMMYLRTILPNNTETIYARLTPVRRVRCIRFRDHRAYAGFEAAA